MNILLTGGAGYIGSDVALALLDSGHKVHIIDNLSRGNKMLVPSSASFTCCDIDESDKITEIIINNNFDALMHFAGFIQVEESVDFPDKYFSNNTDKAIKLFETCQKNNLKNIIFSSTAAAYGNSKKQITDEESKLDPQNPYAESKIRTENYLLQNKDKFNFIILRYFNVAGADQQLRSGQISSKSTHLIKVLSEVIIGKRNCIEIFGNDYNTNDGTAIRDFIHVTDLSDIHVKVLEFLLENLESNIFNCGYGYGYSVLEVINTANKIYNGRINFKISQRRKGDVEKLVSDTSKILNHINWKPKFNNLESIITSSVKWEKYLNEKNF